MCAFYNVWNVCDIPVGGRLSRTVSRGGKKSERFKWSVTLGGTGVYGASPSSALWLTGVWNNTEMKPSFIFISEPRGFVPMSPRAPLRHRDETFSPDVARTHAGASSGHRGVRALPHQRAEGTCWCSATSAWLCNSITRCNSIIL